MRTALQEMDPKRAANIPVGKGRMIRAQALHDGVPGGKELHAVHAGAADGEPRTCRATFGAQIGVGVQTSRF